MRQALQLPSSFGEVGPADLDVLPATWTTAKLERHRQLRAITMLSRVVEPLLWALVRGMPVDVRERAEKCNIALIAAMVPLLRWVCFAEGFRTIGCVEPPSVFRPLAEPIEPVNGSTGSFLGEAAVRFVDEYLSKPPHQDAELVTKLVCQEEMKEHQSEPMDRAGMGWLSQWLHLRARVAATSEC